MRKILYIATTADNRNRLDGETVKCRLLKDYLNKLEDIKVISVDTDNWKRHVIKLVCLIIFNYFRADKIVVSSADKGAHIVLNFFRKINCHKPIYYFVIGGSLSKNIKERKWNVSTYNRLDRIYVEAKILKNELTDLDISNVLVLNNFRKIGKFKNKYKKSNIIRFVYFGRVIKEKGIEESIKLVNRLNDDGIKCSFDIYGQCSPDYLNYISKCFNDYTKYNGEILPDSVKEYEILSQYDIFLFPTFYPGEGLPGSLIDAYISGLAMVASDWKYAREYVVDNVNGVIFDYLDYEDMYNKTKKMINSNKVQSFKKKSYELSKKYLIDQCLSEFKEEIVK